MLASAGKMQASCTKTTSHSKYSIIIIILYDLPQKITSTKNYIYTKIIVVRKHK
jgi:hypothetical protein